MVWGDDHIDQSKIVIWRSGKEWSSVYWIKTKTQLPGFQNISVMTIPRQKRIIPEHAIAILNNTSRSFTKQISHRRLMRLPRKIPTKSQDHIFWVKNIPWDPTDKEFQTAKSSWTETLTSYWSIIVSINRSTKNYLKVFLDRIANIKSGSIPG